jgi:cell division protein FtsQ
MSSRTETPDEERTVRVARRRFARRQWARRWLAWRIVLAAVLVVAVLAGLVWLVFFSSVLAVRGVRVEGTGVLDPRQVRRVAAVPTGSPLATVDLGLVEARVERLRPVLSVDVSRAWPDRVRIDVTERVAVAVVQTSEGLRGVDEEGVVFRRFLSRPADLPLLVVSGADAAAAAEDSAPQDALAEAAMVVATLPTGLAARVDHVSVRTVDTISLELRNGRTVLWGSADESVDKAEVLGVLLEQKASTYDVSVPGRPVIRP